MTTDVVADHPAIARLQDYLHERYGRPLDDAELAKVKALIAQVPAKRRPDLAQPMFLFVTQANCPRLFDLCMAIFGIRVSSEVLLRPAVIGAFRDMVFDKYRTFSGSDVTDERFVSLLRSAARHHGASFESDCIWAALSVLEDVRWGGATLEGFQARLLGRLALLEKIISEKAFILPVIGDALILGLPKTLKPEQAPFACRLLWYVHDTLNFNEERCREKLMELRAVAGLEEVCEHLCPGGYEDFTRMIRNGLLPFEEEGFERILRKRPEEVLAYLLKPGIGDLRQIISDSLLRVVFSRDWLYFSHLGRPENMKVPGLLQKFCLLLAQDQFMRDRLGRIKEIGGRNLYDLSFSYAFLLGHRYLSELGLVEPLPKVLEMGSVDRLAQVYSQYDPTRALDEQRPQYLELIRSNLVPSCGRVYPKLAAAYGWPERDAIGLSEMVERVCIYWSTYRVFHGVNHTIGLDDPLFEQIFTPDGAPEAVKLVLSQAPQELIHEMCLNNKDLIIGAIDLQLLGPEYLNNASDPGCTALMMKVLEL
ncbi:hypothetical protein HNP46_000498 [Pseudomonas nitritireducens]|uniref:Uncharacterized protein n=1 Tax=Pseudomonas nitroreducens TaxID=46680 RepID=A0A7W7KF54_PSENT|nr:hypothetical protein [Pseudomonas nitritireducens]MBB4861687.1 hypothetical protein [Pseudomonas nitritireducens]